ncbi:MAG: LytTR family DNA-binding domain-containing protein [Spirochaetaceae bacterium]|nr:LytTR family DNA-binding domain-containing protein [Spirochaetaceae bacterium]
MERGVKPPMRSAYRELATPSMVWLVAGIAFSLMAIVAVLGPMGTLHTLTLTQRLAYFGAITIVEVPICFASGLFTMYVMRKRGLIQLMLALALMCSFVVAPGAPLAVSLYGVFHGGALPKASLIEIYAFGVLMFSTGTGLAFYVLCLRVTRLAQRNGEAKVPSDVSPSVFDGSEDVAVAMSVGSTSATAGDDRPQYSAPARVGDSASNAPGATVESSGAQPPDSGVSAPELRLPAEIGEDIVYAHVSGHYVEVVTTAGTAVVMMRLSDVARALEKQGMQTHRSYWAAYRHIVRLQSTDHRGVLHLTADQRVPVSRSFHRAVRAYMANRNDRSSTLSAGG